MRGPGMTMHRLPLFVWSVLVTTFLFLLSLPVLAGVFARDKVAMPWLNLTICSELLKDYTPNISGQTYIRAFAIWPNKRLVPIWPA